MSDFQDCMQIHASQAHNVADQIRRFHTRKQPFRIYHGWTNSTRDSPYRRDNIVDTSALDKVVFIDTAKQSAYVEPNVTMEKLVDATLPYGLIAPVVMEFPAITVGGGFSGMAGESSSFKYGTFDATIRSIEIILASGETLIASAKQNADLFYGASGSCGTLGVITLLEIELIKAEPYVEILYQPVNSIHDAVEGIRAASADVTLHYLDGIVFSQTSGVVMKGKLVATPGSGTRVERFTRSYDQWFYRNAEKKFATSQNMQSWVEYVPIKDYLFRYDRGAFWGGKYAFKYFMMPFNRITRWILDPYLHTRVVYHAFHASGLSTRTLVQDLSFPVSKAEEFMNFSHDFLGIYPLWLCPLAINREDPRRNFVVGRDVPITETQVLNIGIWGLGPSNRDAFIALNRELESKVRSFSGVKCLYAHAYYSEEEFWDIYDKPRYDELRQKYAAANLPTFYEKVRVKLDNKSQIQTSWLAWFVALLWTIWPVAGLYGVYRATLGGEYLLRKKRSD